MNTQQALEVARQAMKHLEDAADCLASLEAELGDLPVGRIVSTLTLPWLYDLMGSVHGGRNALRIGTLEAVTGLVEDEAETFARDAERRAQPC